jgi:hypothetical protein
MGKLKVFYSWQAEAPARIGRTFVHEAIEEALELLKSSARVFEAERLGPRDLPDEDRSSGSPGQLKDLLKELDSAVAFVAGVTPLGQVSRDRETVGAGTVRRYVDSDVAFETGYALHALGNRKLVLLFNAHFGWHDELPADLRNRGGAIAFTLVPNASRPEIQAERKRLVSRLVSALRQAIAAAPGTPAGAGDAVGSRAAYFGKGEVLARSGRPGPAEISYSYVADMLCFIRLMPLPPLSTPLGLAQLRKAIERAPLMNREPQGSLSGTNDYGAIAFEPAVPPNRGPGNLAASTQLFINGEVWSISHALIAHDRDERPDWIRLPFVSSVTFERAFYDQLRGLVSFALEQLSLSAPWEVECGIAGSRGLHLWNSGQETLGPIVQPNVVLRRTLRTASPEEIDELLLELFKLLHSSAGSERSANLNGFPPARPR